ncbi:hypothetical protein DNL40_02915 [Xylanimonas oleitrophica]|uniref:Uncharacterized protein n=1 Tax=Xylanimonas oleitrophica TaxID=2607479 RepID=A0A2W5XXA6_9MICO|nr:hypothetical protein [Xylanimonas oleitrophica]PZR55338.1 hypothetical protein DNL40_02915 [Xylanimonas oleitrophica]
MAVPARIAPVLQRINPYVVPLARRVPPWVVVHHVGRVTGRAFQTPVVAFAARAPLDPTVTAAPRTPVQTKSVRDILVALPLPWGEDTDWAQNALAAGAFTLTRQGTDYDVTDVRVVDAREAAALGVKASAATELLRVRAFLVGTLHRSVLPDI